ncbi:MAG: sulfatase [Acidobacteria bacterium]|nr:sulfatase [Acidobacteriota bacterium]HJO79574.1 arylsulfatase [Acidimicrobiales bacterium]
MGRRGEDSAFKGTIGRTHAESEPWWPETATAPEDSPNVLVVLLDDTGFAHLGCYGSSIDTPNIDRLAESGLRYTNFHTTALCSPTRACLLTGRNHHSVGMRAVSNFDSGYPHMRGYIADHAATVAEVLKDNGYATACVGKWHLAPMAQASAAGPFDHWPLQRGFDRFYGFLQGETDQFHPELTADNHHIDPPAEPEDGYHVSEDLVDKAIGFVSDTRSLRPDRPFFLYLAFGATHAPHQAPRPYLEKYKGQFDAGWDITRQEWFQNQLELGVVPPDTILAPRNPGVEAWDDLSHNQQRFACRLQEAFAAMLDHTDAQIGRLIDHLELLGILDDTVVMLLSDNGASQEGGPTGVTDEMKYFNNFQEDVDSAVERLDDIGGPHSHSNYPWGWAQAGNTPMRWYKQTTHGGGVRDPLIIHWPGGISESGGRRNQFHHITDLTPTLLDLVGLDMPAQRNGRELTPMTGTSLEYTFNGPEEPTRKGAQYFEMFGHRAICSDGWKAVTRHVPDAPYDEERWELFHLDKDVSETNDLAEAEPERLKSLIDLWWAEAESNGVLPLDDRTLELFRPRFGPGTPHQGRTYRYTPPISHIPAGAAATLGNRSFLVEASILRPEGGEGVIMAVGTENLGLSLFVKEERLVFDYNIFTDHHVVRSLQHLPIGEATVGVHFYRDGSTGTATLLLDGEAGGSMPVPFVIRILGSTGLDVGRDALSAVSEEYVGPFPFTGTLREVVIHLPSRGVGETTEDALLAMRMELALE